MHAAHTVPFIPLLDTTSGVVLSHRVLLDRSGSNLPRVFQIIFRSRLSLDLAVCAASRHLRTRGRDRGNVTHKWLVHPAVSMSYSLWWQDCCISVVDGKLYETRTTKQRHFRSRCWGDIFLFILSHRDVVGFDEEGSFVRRRRKMETKLKNISKMPSLFFLAAGGAWPFQ